MYLWLTRTCWFPGRRYFCPAGYHPNRQDHTLDGVGDDDDDGDEHCGMLRD